MGLPESAPRLTEIDYFETERAAQFKSEFFDGEMFAMAGGSPEHSLIGANLTAEIRNLLKGRTCAAYSADLRIKIEATGLCTYPDMSVVCGPLQFAPGTKDTIVNPVLLAEVLSDSTEGYDRGTKFEHYRQIPSLRTYLLVSQKEPLIEQFSRQPDGSWLLTDATGLKAKLKIPSLRIILLLAGVFAKVKFARAPIRVASKARVS
jgi:Uma2 family endonuclease